MVKETNQLKFGDFQVIVIMVAYSQKVFYLGYVLKKVPNHYPEFFHFTSRGGDYCSVNYQSGLPKNSFSKYTCITMY